MSLRITFNSSWFYYVRLHSKPRKNVVWVILFKHKAIQYSDSSNILCNKNLPLCLPSLQQTFSQEEKKKKKTTQKTPCTLHTCCFFSSFKQSCKMWLFSRLSQSGAVCVGSGWSHWPKARRQALITGPSASRCLFEHFTPSAQFLSSRPFFKSPPVFPHSACGLQSASFQHHQSLVPRGHFSVFSILPLKPTCS